MISVVLLGAGNVAHHLYNAFSASENVQIKQWYNRSIRTLEPYKTTVNVTDDLNKLLDADIYVIAVSDDAIAQLSSALPFEDRFVVHTSGSASIHDLDKKNRRGVFYPLQTFSKDVDLDFSQVPLCLETLNKSDYQVLKSLAESVSNTVKRVNSNQRAALHLAAVFVNNFTNQLFRVAHEITESESTEFDLLKPLIMETANKIQELSPYLAQTGPAKRHDKKTIKRHLKLLENEHHKDIYELLTASIQKTHGR
ncbi:DUF2520 domain-containing protein [Psychroserpens sp.]|uniref:Rossmann-like and DUF2520 domain-containing protein n=1 Tax=Psychroserpens sp. TaxID=2020870 RepID=UPI001B0F9326|nr:DUF2520 domain-containing protein [Psychroserpens sp.]MBO6607531.1 DUF2520 domain-containing protein [Psychroserpens sp.]MBO6631070.1 DUF2520 domain-containing protein [Psychroserpens sp.]MBO6655191.1 DUF2520 domain-containing protein [Psychroserpens sp.]MBO6683219.1 DUF2520 domain-containing protein [Psychroserpens sp.]MBO6749783.1 DUF2520 domain-containing protein [Psychroserpens sp.]